MFYDPPNISSLTIGIFLGSQTGNCCSESGGSNTPCQSINRKDQLIQANAFSPDGIGQINTIKKTHASGDEICGSQYDCSGDNIIGGIGDTCGGKYVGCTCSEGRVFSNGTCVCDTSCKVGAIYYSDGTCSACVVSGKTPIGVVVKDNQLVMSQKSSSEMKWSNDDVDTSLSNYTSKDAAKTDFYGKCNTATIMADNTSNIAAKYCNDYTTAGTSAGDWYLPAAGELYSYVYGNYSSINIAMTELGWIWSGVYLWSSSEYSKINAWYVGFSSGGVGAELKEKKLWYVICLLNI